VTAHKTILVVEDESELREILSVGLSQAGFKVIPASGAQEALALAISTTPALVLSDIRMPGGSGLDLLAALRARHATSPPVVLMTGYADVTQAEALTRGATSLLQKPFKMQALIELVESILSTGSPEKSRSRAA